MVQRPAAGESADDAAARARRRTGAAAARAVRPERAGEAEEREAASTPRGFADRARRAGLRGERLLARDHAGRGGHRTDVVGRCLRRDRSAAVDEQGRSLLVRTSRGPAARALSRWRPVHLEPSSAPTVPGRGGRDGDPLDLAEALERVLSGQGP